MPMTIPGMASSNNHTTSKPAKLPIDNTRASVASAFFGDESSVAAPAYSWGDAADAVCVVHCAPSHQR